MQPLTRHDFSNDYRNSRVDPSAGKGRWARHTIRDVYCILHNVFAPTHSAIDLTSKTRLGRQQVPFSSGVYDLGGSGIKLSNFGGACSTSSATKPVILLSL